MKLVTYIEIQFGLYTLNILIAEIMHISKNRHTGSLLLCHGNRLYLAQYFIRRRARQLISTVTRVSVTTIKEYFILIFSFLNGARKADIGGRELHIKTKIPQNTPTPHGKVTLSHKNSNNSPIEGPKGVDSRRAHPTINTCSM